MRPERFTAVSADGSEVDAWIMRPAGYEPGKKYPTLLNIHGGPYGQYGVALLRRVPGVLRRRLRGRLLQPARLVRRHARSGRGPSAAPARRGPGWGSVDYEDCMAVIDEAVRRFDFVDADRLGVIGGSYGGYMTSWIVGHTDRFKAGRVRARRQQLRLAVGLQRLRLGLQGLHRRVPLRGRGRVPQDVARRPTREDIHTPLLILHSEDDLRCPVEQAEHLFVTLRLLKRPVELVRFPAESHELTRSGSPVHRVQRFELVVEWFDRYLKG